MPPMSEESRLDYLEKVTEDHSRQIGEIAVSVKSLSDHMGNLAEVTRSIDTKVDEMQKPKWGLMATFIGVGMVVTGAVWGLAIAPTSQAINVVRDQVDSLSTKVEEISTTRHTSTDDMLIMESEKEIRMSEDKHNREIDELHFRYLEKEIKELREEILTNE
jgi:hypothetical protein